MYLTLKKYGNEEKAIEWASNLNENFEGENFSNFNPSTQVYQLVLELNGKSKKLNSEITEKYNDGK